MLGLSSKWWSRIVSMILSADCEVNESREPLKHIEHCWRCYSRYEALSYQTWMRSIFKGFFTVSWAYLTRIKIKRSKCAQSIREQFLLRYWCSKKFLTFPKNIFSVDPKTGTWFFRWNLKSQGISLRFPLCKNMLLHNGNLKEMPWDLRFRRKNHVPIFGSTEKIFSEKVGNFFEHQGRLKICSRIDWEHSQPLKITPRPCLKKNSFFPP